LNVNKNFIYVAVSRVDVDEDMRKMEKNDNEYKKIIMKPFYNSCEESQKGPQKGIAIYRFKFKLEKPTNQSANETANEIDFDEGYCWNNLSGICRFIEDVDPSKNDDSIENDILRKFIILNFDGIYSFEYNESNKSFNLKDKFRYPRIIKNELKNLNTKKDLSSCMDQLLLCLYDKYFLVEHYKNNAQFLEGK